MAVKVASVDASFYRLVVNLDNSSTWLSRDGNHAMRILLKHVGNCSRSSDRHSCWFQCKATTLDAINTRAKLQAELDRLDNQSMAPTLFDIKVFAVRPSDGKLTIVSSIARVNALRAAGYRIEIDLRLATNFPLTMKDRDALLGNLCHEIHRVEGHMLQTAIVHHIHTRPDNPWQVIEAMRKHIEQALT